MVTRNSANEPTAAAGKVLQGQGVGVASDFSTATYPSTASTAGKVLLSNGTNFVESTPTFPNASASSGKFIRSDGTNWIASTPTLPTTAGTSGKVLQSDGTNFVESTATFPSTATSTGTILRANGTNWVATTATYPTTTTANALLYSSATNTVDELTATANRILVTTSGGVPQWGTQVTGDFTFTSSGAGVNRTVTVSSTDNTSGSTAATIVATVGGGTAGDPKYQATVTGVTTFSWGIDNSDSDAFVISASTSLGTSNVFRSTTAGEINYPLQPAFLANLGSTALNKTGNGASYTIGTDALTEIFDQNSDFNTNGTFTAPVTGRYHIGSEVYVTGCTNATSFSITLVTSNRSYNAIIGRNASAQDCSPVLSALADMDSADTFTATITVSGEAGNTCDIVGGSTIGTSMWGYLEC